MVVCDPGRLGFEASDPERVPPAQPWALELESFRSRLRQEGDAVWDTIAAEHASLAR